jgi:hypothetical protein
MLNLAEGSPFKGSKFNKKSYEEGDLYRWSSLRSAYLAEANVDAASMYAANGWGPWALNAGPGTRGLTPTPSFREMGSGGIWYSPFGWGFYSPWLSYEAPFFGYGYGYGYGGGRHLHRFSNYREWGSRSPYIASNSDFLKAKLRFCCEKT